ncbi:probable phospholipid-transporting ATPase 4 [Tanacetum coccineum]
MIAPLVFVVGISMLKEGVEDWHRFLQDLEVNSRKVKVHVGNGIFVDRTWKVVRVGDVVKVNKNEYFPSDLLLLSSSYEDELLQTKFDKFRATVRCEDPNSSLYTFVANLEFGDDESYSLSPSQILLRDSKLRNTDYVYGVAIFTGRDTKVVRNSMKSPSKRSRIERKMDHVIYVLFFMLLLISLILRLVLYLLRALILYGYLIPISLYVSIEVVKFLQAMLINNDQHLFDDMSGKSVEARTSNLNEELGQVEMILTDKTGTLTCNQMEFRKCSIEGISYGGDVNEIVRAASQRLNIDIESYRYNLDDTNSTPGHSMEMVEMSSSQIKESRNSIMDDEHAKKNSEASGIKGFNFKDDRLMNKMWLHGSNVWDMIMFFRVLALCHTGIPVEDEQTGSHILKYEAESPEEVTIIFDRLGDGGRTYQHATTMHLANYAEDGLRTMVFAYRKIKDSEYEEWSSSFAKAKSIIGPEREEMLENVSETIEKELVLLGAVAVDDKLQDGVAECIDKLAQAGIKIWLLTGDKKETAVNIGFACSLLRHDMQQFHLSLSRDAESKNQLEAMKDDILNQIEASYRVTISEKTKDDPFALVVDGKALEIALRNDLRDHFLQLAVNCASVICCRVSPKQKALITRLVKRYTGKMTLAIGDGANDVGMIQEADIGIGISGMEGMQAVMANSYFVYKKNIVFETYLIYYEQSIQDSRVMSYMMDVSWLLFNSFLNPSVISFDRLERDVSSDICLQFPALYQQGQKGIFFGWKRIIGWMGNGILTSLVIFVLTVYILSPSAFRQGGEVVDIAHLGVITYTSVVWTVNCQIALIITHFTWIQHIFALPPIYSNREYQLLVEAVGPAPMYWIVVLLVVVISLLPYFIYMVIQRSFFPMDDHVIQEMKYGGRKVVVDDETWLREKQSSRKATHIGLSSRVDAKILYLKDQLHKKRMFIINSFTNSPIRRSLTGNPLENRD